MSAAALSVLLAALATQGQHAGHAQNAPGMSAPAAASAKPQGGEPTCAPEHAKMGHCTPRPSPAPARTAPPAAAEKNDPACPPEHARMGHCTPASPAPAGQSIDTAAGTALPAGDAPPPPAPAARYADRVWSMPAMTASRAALRREHGGGTFSQVMFNIAEVQVRDGRDGYRWDGEGWFGGDINRFVVKSEGEGEFGDRVHGEVQALYSRAVGPYFNLQAGVRQDIGAPRRYATIGVEGLAPYWFDIEATAFLSDHGELLGRVEGYYDQRITQRLILQPRAEVNIAAHAVAPRRSGAGLVDAELGLRLRYEIRREFAPYVGVTWERAFGGTRRLRRAAGDDTGGFALSLGLRSWF